jgi:hypothetical protein
MIGPVEQLHIDNGFFFKLQKLPKKTSYVLKMPECNVFNHIKPYERTYTLKGDIIIANDSYKDKTSKVKIPIHVFRPLVFLDVLLQVSVYGVSPSLVILYDENDRPLISQDIYEFFNVDLTIEQANEEKMLFEEIQSIMNHDFTNNDSTCYKILQNCAINGGLV